MIRLSRRLVNGDGLSVVELEALEWIKVVGLSPTTGQMAVGPASSADIAYTAFTTG